MMLCSKEPMYANCPFDEPSLVPCHLQGSLTAMQKLCLVRILKQERTGLAGQQYVAEQLGPQFVNPKPAGLTAVWKESDNTTPIIFILSSGQTFICEHICSPYAVVAANAGGSLSQPKAAAL